MFSLPSASARSPARSANRSKPPPCSSSRRSFPKSCERSVAIRVSSSNNRNVARVGVVEDRRAVRPLDAQPERVGRPRLKRGRKLTRVAEHELLLVERGRAGHEVNEGAAGRQPRRLEAPAEAELVDLRLILRVGP